MDNESTSAVARQALREGVRTAGSQSAFAKLIGVTQQAVSRWLKNGTPLPADHVPLAEKGTGIPRHRYRPDLYITEASAPAAPPLMPEVRP